MKTVTAIPAMRSAAKKLKARHQTIGFVPTMGFLHEGHLSLVRECRKRADVAVVSIFVNPLQFGPQEDFEQYPRDPEKDAAMLEREGVDFLFCPEAREIYPKGFKTVVAVSDLQDRLCGRSRPGHFSGVATVVLKLFHIVQPDIAFFGQKDAQQAVIIQKLVEDLNLDVKINILPTVREKDGLAMSSRNTYLSAEERQAALVLRRSLSEAEKMFESDESRAKIITSRMREVIAQEPLARIDYVEIVDLKELNPLDRIDQPALAAVAVFIGKTRLIDNVILRSERDKP